LTKYKEVIKPIFHGGTLAGALKGDGIERERRFNREA